MSDPDQVVPGDSGDAAIVPRRRAMKGAVAGALAATWIARAEPASAAPPDLGSVKPEHLHADAIDPLASVPGARTLGSGARQAAPGTLVAEVAAKETPAGAGAQISEALLSLPEVVEGANIRITEQAGETSEIAVVSTPRFQLPSNSELSLAEAYGCYIPELRDNADAKASFRFFGRTLGVFVGGGAGIQFGDGTNELDTTITRTGAGKVTIRGDKGQLVSNSPRIDHTSPALTIAEAHRSATVCVSHATGVTLTFAALAANGLPVGSRGEVLQTGAGPVVFAGSGGVVLRARGSRFRIAEVWSRVSWWVSSPTEVVLSGDLVT